MNLQNKANLSLYGACKLLTYVAVCCGLPLSASLKLALILQVHSNPLATLSLYGWLKPQSGEFKEFSEISEFSVSLIKFLKHSILSKLLILYTTPSKTAIWDDQCIGHPIISVLSS